VVVVLPLLLLAGSLSFLGPQLMPTPLFRVLIVALFFWAAATEVESEFPSFAGTALLSLALILGLAAAILAAARALNARTGE
jgi:hypothetical protein